MAKLNYYVILGVAAFFMQHNVYASDIVSKTSEKQFSKITQNRDNPHLTNQYIKKHFNKNIDISGLVNMQAEYHSKHDSNNHNVTFSIPTVKLNFDVKANDWIEAGAGLFYSDKQFFYYHGMDHKKNIVLDEAFVTIKNFDQSPYFIKVGEQYLPFGSYHRYPIVEPLTQQLSEIRRPSGVVGFVYPSGFYGAGFGYNGLSAPDKSNHGVNGYGAVVGYSHEQEARSCDFGVGFLGNMADVGAISDMLHSPNKNYLSKVSAISINADSINGPFSFGIRYVSALNRFDINDYSFRFDYNQSVIGAKPSAIYISSGYAFKTKGHDSKATIGYQHSWDAYGFYGNQLKMPRARISGFYGVEIIKNLIAGLEYDIDQDYPEKNGGTNKLNHRVAARLSLVI